MVGMAAGGGKHMCMAMARVFAIARAKVLWLNVIAVQELHGIA